MSARINPEPTASHGVPSQSVSHVMTAATALSQTLREPVAGSSSAVDFRVVSTCACVRPGFFSSISAATEATCGVAIDVPPT